MFRNGHTAIISCAALALSACAAPLRLAPEPAASMTQANIGISDARFLVARDMSAFHAEAMSALAKERAWLAAHGRTGDLPPAYYLAISGGGDNGAFGAGFLNGWTASGSRPEFKVVTGVSTGALIAPFAFLGPGYDRQPGEILHQISQKDVFKRRGLVRGITSDAMADTAPLAKLIAQNTDQALLDAIAGRICERAHSPRRHGQPRLPRAGHLEHDCNRRQQGPERASAVPKRAARLGIDPGAFPPVMIDVTVDRSHFQEMHADGGTMTQVFVYPPSLGARLLQQTAPRRRVLYILRNARLDAPWEHVPAQDNVDSDAGNRFAHHDARDRGSLPHIYSVHSETASSSTSPISRSSFRPHPDQQFDTAYMRELFAFGKNAGAGDYAWQKSPPGFDKPVN